MEIRMYRHGEGDFWQRMGPFMASAAVRRELGAPISSDEKTLWWLAINKAGETVGFVAAHLTKSGAQLRHDYVVPQAREQGVYRALAEARMAYLKEQGVKSARATVNGNSLPVYTSLGFREVSRRGKWVVVAWGEGA